MGNINESSMDALFSGLTIAPEPPSQDQKQCLPDNQTKDEELFRERPSTHSSENHKSSKSSGKKESFCVRLEKETLDKTRILAFQNGLNISDVIDYALGDFISRYEKKNGRIKTKGRKVSVSQLI